MDILNLYVLEKVKKIFLKKSKQNLHITTQNCKNVNKQIYLFCLSGHQNNGPKNGPKMFPLILEVSSKKDSNNFSLPKCLKMMKKKQIRLLLY